MNNDDVVWSIINKTFCAHKTQTKSGKFCRHPDNVTGQCNRHSCPLANSQYATIREERGVLYLMLKLPERVPYPAKAWEKVKLSRNVARARKQIREHMMYWRQWNIRRVMDRHKRLREYVDRKRKLALSRKKKIVALSRKVERREARKEEKAYLAARLETSIEKELLERLKGSLTENEIYNINQKVFNKTLDAKEKEEEEEEEDESEEETESEEEDVVYTSASENEEDEEEEIEDIGDFDEEEEEEEEEMVLVPAARRRANVTLEYDNDD